MSVPRRHHFIPRLYLKGFTLRGGESDRLWVFDQREGRQWPSTPKQSAHKRDFNRIDARSGGDPMAVERHFSKLEDEIAPVLREIIATRRLPAGPAAYAVFIKFIALSICRIPALRSAVSSFFEAARANEEFAREWLARHGDPQPPAEAETIDQTWLVKNIVHCMRALLRPLAQRKWSLWVVADDAPDLICSDNPVALAWTIGGTGPWPPGFDLLHTQVSCPLDRCLLVVGSFEGQPDMLSLDARMVAAANSGTARQANQLYSATDDFVWEMRDGRIGSKADLIDQLRDGRRD